MKQKVEISRNKAENLLEIISKEQSKAFDKLKAAEPALKEAEMALQVFIKPSFNFLQQLLCSEHHEFG